MPPTWFDKPACQRQSVYNSMASLIFGFLFTAARLRVCGYTASHLQLHAGARLGVYSSAGSRSQLHGTVFTTSHRCTASCLQLHAGAWLEYIGHITYNIWRYDVEYMICRISSKKHPKPMLNKHIFRSNYGPKIVKKRCPLRSEKSLFSIGNQNLFEKLKLFFVPKFYST